MQSVLATFLRRMLPEAGYKALVTIDPAKVIRHAWYTDFDDMARDALAIGERKIDVYFTCGSFIGHERLQLQSAGARAFWLDVDAGARKPYPTARDAAAAVLEFCNAVGLPFPTLVASGGGIHAYWPLVDTLPLADWNRAATHLKTLCQLHGLRADHGITGDIARILRPPGTWNRKRDRTVQLGKLTDPIDTTWFVAKLQPPATADVDVGEFGGPRIPVYAEVIAGECAQLRSFRDTAGNVSEPFWYAALGLLGACEDGDALAQQWSSGHPDYSPEATAKKYAQAKEKSGPALCTRLEQVGDPLLCKGCPHFGKIKSPISLGRDKPPTQFEPQPPTESVGTNMPQDFFLRNTDGALVRYVQNEDDPDKKIPQVIYEFPLFVRGLYRPESEGRKRCLLLRHRRPGDGWLEATVPLEHLGNDRSLASSLNGDAILVSKSNMKHVTDFLRQSANLAGRSGMMYEQFGWKEDGSFLLGEHRYAPDGTTELVMGDAEFVRRAKLMQPRGELSAWSAAANRLFGEGCEAQSLAVLCGFGAPLMRLFGPAAVGGTILSLYSEGSGKGKTTAADGAASIWGDLKAFDINRRDTNVARFRTISVLNALPVIFDELRDVDPNVIKDFVLDFTGGRDKNRGTKEGAIRAAAESWSTILISTSNRAITDALTYDEDMGPTARVLETEVTLPPGLRASDGDELRRTLIANRGTAGLAFMKALLRPEVKARVTDMLQKQNVHYEQRLGASTQTRYITRLLSCAAIAGVIVNRMGILEFSVDRIMEWAVEQAISTQKTIANGLTPSVELVARFFNEHASNLLVVEGPWKPQAPTMPRKEPMGKLVARVEINTKAAYIDAATWRAWLLRKDRSFQTTMADLRSHGILLADRKSVTLGAGTQWSGGQTACLQIDMRHPLMAGVAADVVAPNVVELSSRVRTATEHYLAPGS